MKFLLRRSIHLFCLVTMLGLCGAASVGSDYADWYSEFGTNDPVDCTVSPWGDWEPCESGTSMFTYRKIRRRSVTRARNNGVPCPVALQLEQEQACTEDEAVVDLFLKQLHSTNKFDYSEGHLLPDDEILPFEKAIAPDCWPWTDSAGGLIAGGGECNSTRSRRRRRWAGEAIEHRNKHILFLLDESGSVGVKNFNIIKRITAALIQTFCGSVKVQPALTRIAVASFDSENHVHYHFDNQYWDHGDELAKAVKRIRYSSRTSASTCIRSALLYVHDNMFVSRSAARLDSKTSDHLIVMITDGCRTCGGGSLSTAREQLEDSKIALVTLYVGNDQSCVESLNQDLSHDAKCYNFFARKSWSKAEDFAKFLEKRKCFINQFRGKLATSCY